MEKQGRHGIGRKEKNEKNKPFVLFVEKNSKGKVTKKSVPKNAGRLQEKFTKELAELAEKFLCQTKTTKNSVLPNARKMQRRLKSRSRLKS